MKKQSSTSTTATTKPNPPAHTVRVGAIQASIWRNETKEGPMFSVTFDRSYKDGDAWKRSDSFGRNNLLVLSNIASQAFEWIAKQSTSATPATATK
jgi:hypothetical protein